MSSIVSTIRSTASKNKLVNILNWSADFIACATRLGAVSGHLNLAWKINQRVYRDVLGVRICEAREFVFVRLTYVS